MYIPPRRSMPAFQKKIHSPRFRLDKAKEWLFGFKQGLASFFLAALLWEWIIGSIVIFGTYTYFNGYFKDF